MANLEPMMQELKACEALEQRTPAKPEERWTICHCHNCHWARMTNRPQYENHATYETM